MLFMNIFPMYHKFGLRRTMCPEGIGANELNVKEGKIDNIWANRYYLDEPFHKIFSAPCTKISPMDIINNIKYDLGKKIMNPYKTLRKFLVNFTISLKFKKYCEIYSDKCLITLPHIYGN